MPFHHPLPLAKGVQNFFKPSDIREKTGEGPLVVIGHRGPGHSIKG